MIRRYLEHRIRHQEYHECDCVLITAHMCVLKKIVVLVSIQSLCIPWYLVNDIVANSMAPNEPILLLSRKQSK